MASEITDDDDGFPWLSWALTGVLTLAGVLMVGLVVSALRPRIQPAAVPRGSTDAAKSVRPPASETPSASPLPTAGALPSGADSSQPAVAAPAVPKETSSPAATAAPAPQTPAQSNAAPGVSPPPSPPTAPQADGPASSPPSATVELTPEPVATVKLTPEPVAAEGAPVAQDAGKRAAFVRAVAEARASMGQRNLAASKRSLQTASANAQGPADQAELERLQALQDHLEQFWDGIRKAVAAMQPVDEIVLSESSRVAVIEASRKELAVQYEGRPRRWRIEAIPMELLGAIAKSSFRSTAGSKLIVGSLLVMDSLGDRAAGGKLWQEAIRGGEEQGKLLLPELNVARAADRRPGGP